MTPRYFLPAEGCRCLFGRCVLTRVFLELKLGVRPWGLNSVRFRWRCFALSIDCELRAQRSLALIVIGGVHLRKRVSSVDIHPPRVVEKQLPQSSALDTRPCSLWDDKRTPIRPSRNNRSVFEFQHAASQFSELQSRQSEYPSLPSIRYVGFMSF